MLKKVPAFQPDLFGIVAVGDDVAVDVGGTLALLVVTWLLQPAH